MTPKRLRKYHVCSYPSGSLNTCFYSKHDLSPAERRRLGAGDIRINAAECLNCKETIISENRHHFVTCRCGFLSVDGGSLYARRLYRDSDQIASYLEKTIYYNKLLKTSSRSCRSQILDSISEAEEELNSNSL